jgi:hypothetical protein
VIDFASLSVTPDLPTSVCAANWIAAICGTTVIGRIVVGGAGGKTARKEEGRYRSEGAAWTFGHIGPKGSQIKPIAREN